MGSSRILFRLVLVVLVIFAMTVSCGKSKQEKAQEAAKATARKNECKETIEKAKEAFENACIFAVESKLESHKTFCGFTKIGTTALGAAHVNPKFVRGQINSMKPTAKKTVESIVHVINTAPEAFGDAKKELANIEQFREKLKEAIDTTESALSICSGE